MRWVRYSSETGPRTGLVVEETVRALEPDVRLVDLIATGMSGLEEGAAQALTRPTEVRLLEDLLLLAPVDPPSVRDFLTFHDHLRNYLGGPHVKIDEAFTEIPGFYFGNAGAVNGPYDDVAIPPGCQRFDFELEVAAVIGRPGRDFSVAEASAHIIGYTVLNDWSARDLQDHEYRLNLGQGKGKDMANTLGPALVTSDELEGFRRGTSFSLGATASVNGERVGSGPLDQMYWSFEEMASFAARGTTLRPGDILGSGTVPTCCLGEAQATQGADFRGWLQPGDVVRLEVEQLGAIEQRIVPGPAPHRLRSGF